MRQVVGMRVDQEMIGKGIEKEREKEIGWIGTETETEGGHQQGHVLLGVERESVIVTETGIEIKIVIVIETEIEIVDLDMAGKMASNSF